jgi:diamine N-acetyltransferase
MLTLRMLKPEDTRLIKSCPQYPPEFTELDYALRDGGWLDEYSTKKGAEILVADDLGEMVGFSILSKDEEGSAEFRIAIHPDKLGKGFGKALAILTLRYGFSTPGISRIRLIVRKNNPRAKKLYETLLFRHTGECTEEIKGKPVDFYRMEIDRGTFFAANLR